ncbi:flagellar hook-associated protein FlgL [Psychrobacillus psychrodurans]|uniref:flagellar hook-associated protein FlgL n=1 Tax=Psychrobacillus psychrodurans TaxID=126157 RepID=UPI001F4EA76F|nr:flagellar hook-associated protein FlgL [Psychrobacillus psychrodurans]MCK1995969.1 flagellar hook-associated protein FlgL [Psychrobacillus psychrodurans]
MRVTQSMLSGNMLRNLSSSYSKMGTLQEQLNTGKKITRPSQDPVIAMKGIGYRSDLNRVEQFERNLGEVNNWLDSSDDGLDKVGQALQRVRELVIDANNDTKTPEDRQKIAKEIEQIKLQIRDLGNTKVGDKYIFSGTNTLSPLYDEATGFLNSAGVNEKVNIEINGGLEITVNTNGIGIFDEIDGMMNQLQTALETNAPLDDFIGLTDKNMDTVLTARSDIGARQNRVEMMENRLSSQNLIVTKQMSDNEDVEYEEAITDLITQESIHRAGLAVGSRIIQPSLVDFLR